MTVPRQVIARRTCLITRRCTQRQFLLLPRAEVVQIFTYCLAEAAHRFGITLFGFELMSNHEHLLVRDNEGNLPEFMAHLHKLVSKAVNDYWKRHENLWAAEQPNVVHTVEASDQFDKLIYLLANPVTADLVDRAHHWPGASSLGQNLTGRAVRVKRPGFFRANGPMPDEVLLRVERLDGFDHLTHDEWRDKVRAHVEAAENRARELRVAKNIRVLGRKAVRRARHTDTPNTVETRRRLRPCIACRNPERRASELAAMMEFRHRYRDARTRWCAGERDALFPVGTYGMVGFGIRVEDSAPIRAAT